MQLHFTLESERGARPLSVTIDDLVIAGWAGRDRAAIEHHIDELAAIGVPRPSAVPLYYRVAANQLTQDSRVQVVGSDTSGEVEAFVFAWQGELYVSIASDHTDRKLETHSVALSKQACVKPVASTAWPLAEVAGHWDELQIRSRIVENDAQVLYQDGTLADLLSAKELIAGYGNFPDGAGMTCGTVGAIGGIRPAPVFEMELHDPRRGRTIRHRYEAVVLPVVA
jgi:hypothetical protein